jgi:predicted transposase
MKTTLTAKLKLLTAPDQFQALRATQLAYRAALNYVSSYSFAHGKTSSGKRMQKATYADLRRQFGLPSQMGATCRARWATPIRPCGPKKKHTEARRLGFTKRRFKGWDKAP